MGCEERAVFMQSVGLELGRVWSRTTDSNGHRLTGFNLTVSSFLQITCKSSKCNVQRSQIQKKINFKF